MPITVTIDASKFSKTVDDIRKAVDTPTTKAKMHEVLREVSDPYVPYDTGRLANTPIVNHLGVTYVVPYAEKVFYGDHINFKKVKHPLATAHWTDVAWANHRNEMMAKFSEIIKEAIKDAK